MRHQTHPRPIYPVLTNLHKDLSDALARLGTRLGKQQPLGLGIPLCLLVRNPARRRIVLYEIELVPDEDDDDPRIGLTLERLDPGFGLLEGGVGRLVRGMSRVWSEQGRGRTWVMS